MCPSFLSAAIEEDFKKWMMTYPQPIATSLSRLVGNRTGLYILDNSLKAAEVTTRYVAACSLASFAARTNAGADGISIPPLEGNLAFGTFNQVIDQIRGKQVEHPLKSAIQVYSKNKPGILDTARQESIAIWLGHLIELRNELDHALDGTTEAKARTIIRNDKPLELLHAILKYFEPLLGCPLFIIDEQRYEQETISAQILWLMGESKDPIPEEIQLKPGVRFTCHPYIAIDKRILDLNPQLIWESVPNRAYNGLLFFDGVYETEINYKSLESEKQEFNGNSVLRLNEITSGQAHTCEEVTLIDNRHLAQVWRAEQKRRIEAVAVLQGKMPWDKFSLENLKWYAQRLAPESQLSPRAIVHLELFDNKETFDKDQIFQALLLFGKEPEIRPLIQRDVIDIRFLGDGARRWKSRHQLSKNIIQSIRQSVQIISKELGIDASIDTLEKTEGTPDYIAVREAILNQFVHQDYHDPRGAAQIEVSSEGVTFFNMGYALIPPNLIIQGGRSQSRNPLIARALGLIHFVELGGTGLRELQRAWRTANQRPPVFNSNKDENNFSLALDWRPVKDAYNKFWKEKIGVTLTEDQARLLNLLADPAGITLDQGVSGTGFTYESTDLIFRDLITQALIEQRDGRYFVKAHLRDLVGEDYNT